MALRQCLKPPTILRERLAFESWPMFLSGLNFLEARMFRSVLLATSFLVGVTGTAWATDITAMNDAERDSFRAEIREYLLSNPEVLMEALAVLEERRAQSAAENDLALVANNRDAIFDDGFSYVGGNPDGDITVVEFLDYQCSFCKRAFPAVEELIASDGNIKIIIKEFPILGEASVMGSRYALAVKSLYGDEAYKSVHDEMMSLRGGLTPQTLARVSDSLDLEHDDIRTEMENEEISTIINTNRELAQRLQIQGTPTFVMGETFVRGFLELDQMRAVVANERENRG